MQKSQQFSIVNAFYTSISKELILIVPPPPSLIVKS